MYLVTASKNMKQKLGGEVERFIITFGDFIIPFLVGDKQQENQYGYRKFEQQYQPV